MPPLPPPLPPKKDVLLAVLESSSAFVHLDPRRDAVRVPDWFKKQPQLILQIGLNLAVPIRDLEVDDEAASCTLSFSRTPHFCYMPWSAIYAIVGEDGRGMVWPDDVPAEVAAQQQAQVRPDKDKKRRPRPKLRAVATDDEAAEDATDDEAADAEAPPGGITPAPEDAGSTEERPAGAAESASPDPAEPAEASRPHSSEAGPRGRSLPSYLRVVK